MADYKTVTCKDCGRTELHWAHGLCHRCYMREYRKTYPDKTIANLREQIAKLEKRLVDAPGYGREEVADFVDAFLEQFEGKCRYRDGVIRVELGGKKAERTL